MTLAVESAALVRVSRNFLSALFLKSNLLSVERLRFIVVILLAKLTFFVFAFCHFEIFFLFQGNKAKARHGLWVLKIRYDDYCGLVKAERLAVVYHLQAQLAKGLDCITVGFFLLYSQSKETKHGKPLRQEYKEFLPSPTLHIHTRSRPFV